jgi:hypothetical protein
MNRDLAARPLAVGDLVYYRLDFQTIGLVVRIVPPRRFDDGRILIRWLPDGLAAQGGSPFGNPAEPYRRLDQLIARQEQQIGRLLARRAAADQALGAGSLRPFGPFPPGKYPWRPPGGWQVGDPVLRRSRDEIGVITDPTRLPGWRPLGPLIRHADGSSERWPAPISFDGLVSLRLRALDGHRARRDVARQLFFHGGFAFDTAISDESA